MVGQGSTFTLFLPTVYKAQSREGRTLQQARAAAAAQAALEIEAPIQPSEIVVREPLVTQLRSVPDDYDSLEPGDRVLLVIEDDTTFALTLLEMGRQSGFKGVVATSGAQALELAR